MKPSHSLAMIAATTLLALNPAWAADVPAGQAGKAVALDRMKGNCLACHEMPALGKDNDQPGNLGPALVSLKSKYPERTLLRQRVWDESKFNPNTSMPPFGKHRILTELEIDQVVEFLYGL